MGLQQSVQIQSTKKKIWEIISDIDQASETISGIISVRVIERPEQGMKGLKWEETRKMFGKEAKETMWVIETDDESYYVTQAENHGAIYTSSMHVEGEDGNCTLRMEFDAKATSFGAKISMAIFSLFFRGATKKVILQDLNDIKRKAEND
ncbi:MAG: SRPBCC family protein [Bacteroidetes bacterium]|nr:MAG: SRPBCC family protein [Bacteroidota bacterium]